MKIKRLRITIEPYLGRDLMKELRVEAIVDGTVHAAVTPFDDDDFKSLFDYLMEESRIEILRLVKAHGHNNKLRDGATERRPSSQET